jgi:hypothetical protein
MADAGKKVVVVTMSRASAKVVAVFAEKANLTWRARFTTATQTVEPANIDTEWAGLRLLVYCRPSPLARRCAQHFHCLSLTRQFPPHTPSVGKVSLQQTHQVRDLEDATCSRSRTSEC